MEKNLPIDESSGLAYCRGKLFTHNDSGNAPQIYRLDPNTGVIMQTFTLQGVYNNDWEDLATDGDFLYIADTGNNYNGGRIDLAIYKIRLNDFPDTGDHTIPLSKIQTIRFYYPEQGLTPPLVDINSTPYDCEAIVVRNDVIHLFTKDWTSVNAGYGTSEYLLPNVPHPDDEKYPAKFYHRHDKIGFLVTSADNAGVNELVLCGYQTTMLAEHYMRVYSGFQGDDITTGTVTQLHMGNALSVGQIEGICFSPNPFYGFVSNEKFKKIITYGAKLKTFNLSYPLSKQIEIATGTAGGGIQGSIRFNSERNEIEGFNGLYWMPIVKN